MSIQFKKVVIRNEGRKLSECAREIEGAALQDIQWEERHYVIGW